MEERGSRTILLAVSRALQPHGLRDESRTRIRGVHADRIGLRMQNSAITLIGEWKVSWKFASGYRDQDPNSRQHHQFRQVGSQVL